MKIGYARVSTTDQSLDLQLDALNNEGCEKIYQEKASGAKSDRPELEACLQYLRSGDTLVVYKLDRLGRSLKHLLDTINSLSEKGIGFTSISDPIDTTTPQGRLIFNIFGSLAEFERDLIRERTKAGLEAARARGRFGGRPKGLSQEAIRKSYIVKALYEEGRMSITEICQELKMGRSTLYRYLEERGVKITTHKRRYAKH